MKSNMREKRPIKEPGGILLVALGMVEVEIETAIETLYPTTSSLTILASKNTAALLKLMKFGFMHHLDCAVS